LKLAIVALTEGGVLLARDLGTSLPEAAIYVPSRFSLSSDQHLYTGPVSDLLPQLFTQVEGLVCIMATGIVIRILAPHLRGKEIDPAVCVMDEKGEHVISLLSGHLGGANDLARDIATICGGRPVITTATDVNGLPAWDDIARREKLSIEPLKNVRRLNSMLLEREEIVLVDPQQLIASYYTDLSNIRPMESLAEALKVEAKGLVFVSNRDGSEWAEREDILLLHPKNLVVGIGCNRGTTSIEIEQVVTETFARLHLSTASVASLASVEAKRDEVGLLEYAQRFSLPINFHSADDLNRIKSPSPPSEHALAAVGATGVCEPAALLSANNISLLLSKQKCGNVTIAIAEKV
jgi:cobalt-precorrin 5A hydrolase